jgi:hypothetical protein
MTHLFSLALIFIVILIFVYFAIIKPEIRNIIIVALTLRLVVLVAGNYISLPDSSADANTYESLAAFFAKDGFFEFYNNLILDKLDKGNFLSFLIAVPYSVLGRNILIPIAINLLLSMGTVILGWYVAKKIWDSASSKKLAWIIALYPSLLLYSSVVLREVYIWFFLLLAINSIVNWSKTNETKQIIFALLNFYILSLFHGPLALGAFVFLFVVASHQIVEIYSRSKGIKIKIRDLFLITIVFVILGNFFLGNFNIPKLTTFHFLDNLDEIVIRSEFTTRGEASYPTWSKFNDRIDILYKIPAKLILFYVSPLPWEVKKLGHLMIMFDGFFYIFLIFLLSKNIKNIWNNYILRILVIIFIFYSIIFALGIGNFGTGFRHRTKFLILLMLIVAPYLPKITLKRKIKS